MRIGAAVIVVTLCLVLSGCADGPQDESGADGRPVTFKGTLDAKSMEPTLMKGDRVIATEVDPADLVIGDIVVYTNPGRWLAGEEGEGQLVHRVIGTPGDTVTCCDSAGRISVNQKSMDEPYIASDLRSCNAPIPEWATKVGSSLRAACDWTIGPIPDGRLFVLGDNRDFAADSRAHLCTPGEDSCADNPWVPFELVRGRVDLP